MLEALQRIPSHAYKTTKKMKNKLFIFLFLLSVGSAVGQEFPYPALPDSLRTPEERMDFLLGNYWSRFDFNDTTATNCQVGEQGFSDFIYTLGYADEKQKERAAADFVRRAFATEWGARHYDHLMEHYLFNPNSPLRNDLVYAALLREIVDGCHTCDGAMQERNRFRLSQVSKNQVGTVATDFAYRTRQGAEGRMHEHESDWLLLVFHDPDCENCERILPQLMLEPVLRDSRVQVLAIYGDSDYESWKRKTYAMPSNWTDAYSPDGEIHSKTLYYLPATPSLYLLDKKKQVVLKDASPEVVLKMLSDLLKNG